MSGRRFPVKWGKLFICPMCHYEANAYFNASVNVHHSFYREWHWQPFLNVRQTFLRPRLPEEMFAYSPMLWTWLAFPLSSAMHVARSLEQNGTSAKRTRFCFSSAMIGR